MYLISFLGPGSLVLARHPLIISVQCMDIGLAGNRLELGVGFGLW